MINCGEVVICKMNPVNDYLGPIFDDIFASLIRDRYLAFAYGGADVGEYLTRHNAVQAIHITGSARTFDLIVYGPGEEGQRRKAADDRVVDKPVNSELGGVGATIAARPVAQSRLPVSSRPRGHPETAQCRAQLRRQPGPRSSPAYWDGSSQMLREVRAGPGRLRAEGRLCPRHRGAPERVAASRAHRRGAGRRRETAVRGLRSGHRALRVQHRVVRPGHGDDLAAGDAGQFLQRAVDFCNDKLYGTLSVNLIVHPATRRQLGADFDRAIAALRYGGIGINVWWAPRFCSPGPGGRNRGLQLHRYPVGHRGGAQRAGVQQVAQDRRVRAIPPVSPLDPQRGVHLVPQAAVVPDQKNRRIHRPQAHRVRGGAIGSEAASLVRLSPPRRIRQAQLELVRDAQRPVDIAVHAGGTPLPGRVEVRDLQDTAHITGTVGVATGLTTQ